MFFFRSIFFSPAHRGGEKKKKRSAAASRVCVANFEKVALLPELVQVLGRVVREAQELALGKVQRRRRVTLRRDAPLVRQLQDLLLRRLKKRTRAKRVLSTTYLRERQRERWRLSKKRLPQTPAKCQKTEGSSPPSPLASPPRFARAYSPVSCARVTREKGNRFENPKWAKSCLLLRAKGTAQRPRESRLTAK